MNLNEVTVDDAAKYLNKSKRRIQQMIIKDMLKARQCTNDRGGGYCHIIDITSFPPEIQKRIIENKLGKNQRINENIKENDRKQEIITKTDTNNFQKIEKKEGETESIETKAIKRKEIIIPEKASQIGIARYRLVKAWRAEMDKRPYKERRKAGEAFLLAYNAGGIFPELLKKTGRITEKNLYKYSRLLTENNDDYYSISPGHGGWKLHGTTKYRKRNLPARAQAALLRCYLHPNKPGISMAIAAARHILEKNNIKIESSDATYRRWLKDFKTKHNDVVIMAREGEKAYWDKVGAYITRDDSLLSVGQVLVADGHDLNFEILHPDTGRPCRMKLIMFYDWASRFPAGWQIMPTENTSAIMAALRSAIINLGRMPDVVYLDNGKAFKAKIFTKTDPDLYELSGIYARLGIATSFALPYNARSKPVERFFLTLNEQFERLLPSYTGSSIPDKPAWRMRNEKHHRKLHENNNWIPTIREAAYLINEYFKWYGEQIHSGIKEKPAEKFFAGKGPGVDISDLNFQFLWPDKASPKRCRFTRWGVDYEADFLHGLSGEILIRYDIAGLDKIYCYTLEGHYLGEALPVAALHPMARLLGSQASVEQVKKALKGHRKLLKDTKEKLGLLGMEKQDIESLNVLPFNRKVPILPELATANLPDNNEMSSQEIKRLEDVAKKALQEEEKDKKAVDMPARPGYFKSEIARYEYLFRLLFQHGYPLTDEDREFMTEYEKKEEFKNYQQRFADLKMMFETFKAEGVRVKS